VACPFAHITVSRARVYRFMLKHNASDWSDTDHPKLSMGTSPITLKETHLDRFIWKY
jgi:hypothetical protein